MRLAGRPGQQQPARESTLARSLEPDESTASRPEALELPELRHRRGSRSTIGPEGGLGDLGTSSVSGESVHSRQSFQNKTALGAFWTRHISISVQPEASRDHLAVERTFLGYFRTSVVFAMMGTFIAQLFVLQERESKFGFKEIGRPMATACLCFSIATILLGTHRTWRHQNAVESGKARAGGFEIAILAFGTITLSTVFLGLMISVNAVGVVRS